MLYEKKIATYRINIKNTDDKKGEFEGYLSIFGNQDLQKDIVVKGAFQKSIEIAKSTMKDKDSSYLYPILFQHDPDRAIGGFTEVEEDEKGLRVKGQLDLDIEDGRRAYSGLKKGYLQGLSIGYQVIEDEMAKGGDSRLLKEINLFEGSVVTFPANPLAYVTPANVKKAAASSGDDDSEADNNLAAVIKELTASINKLISLLSTDEQEDQTDNSGKNAALQTIKAESQKDNSANDEELKQSLKEEIILKNLIDQMKMIAR